MGCSNPHPHGQIWAQQSIPVEGGKEQIRQKTYYEKHGRTLLSDYFAAELKSGERILVENKHFVALVPFWATWPYEALHMHFYPPLLRSATVKKFMVGYEMMANPQRDITAEQSAETLRSLPKTHYKK
jgi:UDPglucose--hexose-1-phosphate uridylyltransferase